jgi:hypothetical protein
MFNRRVGWIEVPGSKVVAPERYDPGSLRVSEKFAVGWFVRLPGVGTAGTSRADGPPVPPEPGPANEGPLTARRAATANVRRTRVDARRTTHDDANSPK